MVTSKTPWGCFHSSISNGLSTRRLRIPSTNWASSCTCKTPTRTNMGGSVTKQIATELRDRSYQIWKPVSNYLLPRFLYLFRNYFLVTKVAPTPIYYSCVMLVFQYVCVNIWRLQVAEEQALVISFLMKMDSTGRYVHAVIFFLLWRDMPVVVLQLI